MRYHYEKPSLYLSRYGSKYVCNHPIYNECTLYMIDDKGLALIQQRFDSDTKKTWWGAIDPWLTDEIYLHPKFEDVFESRSNTSKDGLYPTVNIRQLMLALKMKPIERENWEMYFDRKTI